MIPSPKLLRIGSTKRCCYQCVAWQEDERIADIGDCTNDPPTHTGVVQATHSQQVCDDFEPAARTERRAG